MLNSFDLTPRSPSPTPPLDVDKLILRTVLRAVRPDQAKP